MNTFFKDIEVVGIENIPKEGPLIICGNHSNQFVDGMLIITKLPRELGFIMAAKSIRRPLVGFFAKKVDVIPVERPQDLAFEGKGKILSIKNNTAYGENTNFLKELKIGDTILIKTIKRKEFVVKEIVSDQEIKLIPSASNPTDVPTINSVFKTMPKIDQVGLFNAVYKHLNENKCVGIFPEGGSHDRTELIELKAGVSIMALGAHAKNGTKAKIVTIGLNYYQANEFRSKVILDIGDPYEIPQEIYDLYAKNKKEAVQKLLEEIENRLKSCLIHAPSYSELSAIFMCRSIYKPDTYTLTAEEEFTLNRRFALGIEKFREHPEIRNILTRVANYNDRLKTLGIKDEEVPNFKKRYFYDILSIGKSLGLFCFNAAFALPGLVLTGPLAYICKYFGEVERKKALAGSSVKIEGFDVVASYKIICAFILFPLASLGITSAFYLWTKYMMFQPIYQKLMSATFFFLWPVYMSIMVRSFDEAYKHQRMLRAKFIAYIRPSQIEKIKAERSELKKMLSRAVDDFGPKVAEGFMSGRVISKDEIEKEVKLLKEVDSVYGLFEQNQSHINNNEKDRGK